MGKREYDYRQDVISIQEEAQANKMFEAFLEAAPQFILQLSILLQTGDIGKNTRNILLYFFVLKIQRSCSKKNGKYFCNWQNWSKHLGEGAYILRSFHHWLLELFLEFGFVLLSSSGFLLLALSVAAVVFGIIGIKAAGPNKELGGEGWAIAGLSIGITNILFVFLVLMLILAAFA